MFSATLFDHDQRRVGAIEISRPDRIIWHGGRAWAIDLQMLELRVLTYKEVRRQPWQEPEELPMATCIMPTSKARIPFLPTALRSWVEQTYPRKELVIISEDPEVAEALPKHPSIAFRDCAVGTTIGQKRNEAVEYSRGEIIMHFDDDDYSYPERMSEQVAALRKYPAQLCGYHTLRFLSDSGITREYQQKDSLHGNSLAYWRDHWERLGGFPKRNWGEDNAFISKTDPNLTVRLDGGEKRMIARHHDSNAGKYTYTPEWRVVEPAKIPLGVPVYLAMLSWNREDVIVENVSALQREAEALRCFGYYPNVIVVDNGSTDETVSKLSAARLDNPLAFHLEHISSNKGAAVGRNRLSWQAIGGYTLLVDCDISVVPGSALAMLHALQSKRTTAACVGANWNNGTEDPAKVTDFCDRITRLEHSPGLALTQYGMFQSGLLREYPFDENFGPGWGGEDNDWAMQVEAATGLQCFMTDEIRYLHRGAHGSLKHLAAGGLDVHADAKSRYEYLIRKWKGHERFKDIVAFFENKVKSGDLLPMEVDG